MKRLIFIISAILLFSISESLSQNYDWPFNDCYQAEFDSCSQNCTDTLTFTKTIMYAGCEIDVSYKVRHCECPEPTTYIMITYIRIPIASPEPCCDLICELFPPGPYAQNCDTNNYSLNCYNNPGDAAAMLALHETLYSMLGDTVFSEVSDAYQCPEKLTVKYFWPSDCFGYCIYDLQESGIGNPAAPIIARAIVMTSCGGYGCCGKTYTYCKDILGNPISTVTTQKGPISCPPSVIPECLSVGMPFDMYGVTYNIANVRTTECLAPCYEKPEE